jgi:hypothetical protein
MGRTIPTFISGEKYATTRNSFFRDGIDGQIQTLGTGGDRGELFFSFSPGSAYALRMGGVERISDPANPGGGSLDHGSPPQPKT